MFFLYSKRTYRPGVRFAETTDFLFDKQSKLANQNLFPILGVPDKVKSLSGPSYPLMNLRGIRRPFHEGQDIDFHLDSAWL